MLRTALLIAALVVLGLVGVATYTYVHLPEMIDQYAADLLADYGVSEIDVSAPQISGNELTFGEIRALGVYQGLRFELVFSALELDYMWRDVLRGRLRSLSIDKLEVSIISSGGQKEASSDPISVADFLPGTYRSQLPLEWLEVKEWRLNLQSSEGESVVARGSLSVTDGMQLHVDTSLFELDVSADMHSSTEQPFGAELNFQHGGSQAGTLTAQLERKLPTQWQWSLQGSLSYQPLLEWLRSSTMGAEFDLPIEQLGAVSLAGTSHFTAMVQHNNDLLLNNSGAALLSQLRVNIAAEHTVDNIAYLGIAEGATAELDTRVIMQEGHFSVNLPSLHFAGRVYTEQLVPDGDTLDWLGWKHSIPLEFSALSSELVLNTDNSFEVELKNTSLVLGNENSRFRIEPLSVRLEGATPEAIEFKSHISARIDTRLRQHSAPQLQLALDQQGSIDASELQLHLTDVAETISYSMTGGVNLATGAGDFDVTLQSQDLAQASTSLLPVLRSLGLFEQNLVITRGELRLHSALQTSGFNLADISQESELILGETSGGLNDYSFDGLVVNARWRGAQGWQTTEPALISMAGLDVGFDVKAITAQLELAHPAPLSEAQLKINEFSAGVFGGRVYLPRASAWRVGGKSNSILLHAENLQLGDIVALQQSEEIRAVGVLEGELPLTIESGRIVIDKGYLHARPPGGTIQYAPGESGRVMASSSKELQLALELLQDFNYETLRSDVQLDRGGNLTLALSLAGKNPALYEGRVIQFNINLEQNVDPLLQSLRMSDKLIEQIERRN